MCQRLRGAETHLRSHILRYWSQGTQYVYFSEQFLRGRFSTVKKASAFKALHKILTNFCLQHNNFYRILLLLMLLVANAVPTGSGAEEAWNLTAEDLGTLIDDAKEKGVRVILVEPNQAETENPEPSRRSVSAVLERLELALLALIQLAKADVAQIDRAIHEQWPERGWSGGIVAILLGAGALLLGYGAERALRRTFVGPASPQATYGQQPARDIAILQAVAAHLGGIVVQLSTAILPFMVFFAPGSPERNVAYAIIITAALYSRLGFLIVDLLLMNLQMGIPVRDALCPGISRTRRKLRLLVIVLGILIAILSLVDRLHLGAGLLELMRLGFAIFFVAGLAQLLWRERFILTAPEARWPSGLLARAAPAATLGYLAAALALFILDELLGDGISGLAILAPIYCGAFALIVHALLYAVFVHTGAICLQPASEHAGDRSSPVHVFSHGAETDVMSATVHARCGESSAVALAIAVWIGTIAWAWEVPLISDDGSRLNAFWSVLLIVLMARIGWLWIRDILDGRLAQERLQPGQVERGDEGGSGGTRLGTLLPLIRTFVLSMLSAITVMIVLAELGFDIAPLFAGAGLVGIAVGFGAQSLVRDIFSGLFFLIDDAFRTGEYIETGGLRGTVEKISIRSMQLRHHTGPLHTIPFGEITQLTNFSRDWVIMKLPIRVTFDTDPEKVRKLVKKLGQDLLSDPVIGDKFVEPLKSQGVREIDDSGQVIRVKFMTRPGDQFLLRKTIYARIRELFEREGIEFARREVRVKVSSSVPLTEQEVQDIAGAAAEGSIGQSDLSP